MDEADLRDKVRLTYSKVADEPQAVHPFRVGRQVADGAGYTLASLARIPSAS
jgi:hypothetical protein